METALALCRFAHFSATMALFGATAFVCVLTPPALSRVLAPAVGRIAAVTIPLAALSALAWLGLEAASMSGSWSALVDPDTLADVLLATAFGAVWQVRLILALALVVALAFGRGRPSPVLAIGAALLLASLGLVGHATMQQGALGALHRVNHALHLLATGAWLGGLPVFALCLRASRDPALRCDAVIAMRRFSFWGQFDVALVVLTGVVNIGLTSGFESLALTTPYRALLAGKLALVAMMIVVALVNRYALAPRIKPGAPALGYLMATSVAEIALGALVVALVSLFGLLDPA